MEGRGNLALFLLCGGGTMINADVCNMALGYIGKQPIVTIDDNTDNAKKCNLYYDPCRRQLLRSFEWNFARRQEKLALIDTDKHGWGQIYNYPEECLLIYRVYEKNNYDNNRFEIFNINNNVKGIACNVEEAYVEFLQDIADLSIWPPDLIIALAHLLAYNITIALAGNSSTMKEQYEMYRAALDEAKLNAAHEQNSMMRSSGFQYITSRW